jgi:hypothetical protein
MLVCQAYKDSERSNEIPFGNAQDKWRFSMRLLLRDGGDYEKCPNEEARLLQNIGQFLPLYTASHLRRLFC